MPKIIEKVHAPFHLTMSTFILFISSIGIFLSIRWVLILKRINYYLHGIDNYLIGLERRNNQGFIIQMNEYLEHAHSPGRITKQQMIIPYMFCSIFMVIFAAVITYNLYRIF